MVDDLKSLKDNLIRSVLQGVTGTDKKSTSALKDIISSLASIAGKGKDEIVQMISKEIGNAVAGVVKEPILEILRTQKIQITVEFGDRVEEKSSTQAKKATQSKVKKKTKKG